MTSIILFIVGLVAGICLGYGGRNKISSILNKDGPGEEKTQKKDGPGEEKH